MKFAKSCLSFVGLLVASLPDRAWAGPAYGACMAGCAQANAICMVTGQIEVCYPLYLTCCLGCAALTCQDGSNFVISAQGVEVKVRDVRVGDLIETIDEGSGNRKMTIVRGNAPVYGLFGFIEVALEGGVAYNVTSEHVVVLRRGEKWEIERAQNVRIGDVMLTSSRALPKVKSTRPFTRSEKWVLSTQDGTALVNGIQMTTFCDDVFDLLPKDYVSAVKTWRRLHAATSPAHMLLGREYFQHDHCADGSPNSTEVVTPIRGSRIVEINKCISEGQPLTFKDLSS